MKTGLKLQKRLRTLHAYLNLFRFNLKKKVLGFDIANQFIQRVDKDSLQLILVRNGATIGNNCDIETGLIFHNCNNYSNLIIENNCHIGKNCFFDLKDKVIIEDNCVISMQTIFITHIDMNKSHLSELYSTGQGCINIENDVYIGAKSTILMNICIGEKSIVGAGSLVNQKVNSKTIVGGVPAKPIKKIYGTQK